jgi:hypothetical protein
MTTSARHMLVRVYNRYAVDMAAAAKSAYDARPDAAAPLPRAIDPEGAAHVDNARATLDVRAMIELAPEEVLRDERVLAFEPLKGHPLRSFVAALPPASHASLRNYAYILGVLCVTTAAAAGDGEEAQQLSRNVLAALSRAQAIRDGDRGDVGDDAGDDGIVDAELAALLRRLREDTDGGGGGDVGGAERRSRGEGGGDGEQSAEAAVAAALEGSKLADLAAEIAAEIDPEKMSQLGDKLAAGGAGDPSAGASPLAGLNFADLTDSNSVFGSIVSKVGSKIQGKLASGELRHEELLGEAVNLLKAFDGATGGGGGAAGSGGSGVLGELLKAAGGAAGAGGGAQGLASQLAGLMRGGGAKGGGGHHHHQKESVRERLRRKLAAESATASSGTASCSSSSKKK